MLEVQEPSPMSKVFSPQNILRLVALATFTGKSLVNYSAHNSDSFRPKLITFSLLIVNS